MTIDASLQVAAAYAAQFPELADSGLTGSWRQLHAKDLGDVLAAHAGWPHGLDSLVDVGQSMATEDTVVPAEVRELRRGPLAMAAFRLCTDDDDHTVAKGIELYRIIDNAWGLASLNENFRANYVDALLRSNQAHMAAAALRDHAWKDQSVAERLALAVSNPWARADSTAISEGEWLARFTTQLAHGSDIAAVRLRPHHGPPFARLEATTPHVTEGALVSVILAAPDDIELLTHSARSILDQTWTSWELLLIHDDSNSDVTDACCSMAASDPRVRSIPTSLRQGRYACLNLGLAMAQGDFIAFQSPDAWSHPERLERQVAHMDEHPHAAACESFALRTTPDLTPITVAESANRRDESLLLVRRSTLSRFGFFDATRVGAGLEFRSRLEHLPDAKIELAAGAASVVCDSEPAATDDPRHMIYVAGFGRGHNNKGLPVPYRKVADRFVCASLLPQRPPEPQWALDVALVADLRSDTPSMQALAASAIHLHRSGLAVGIAHYPGMANTIPCDTLSDRALDLFEAGVAIPAQLNEPWTVHHALVLDAALLQFRPRWPTLWETTRVTALEHPIPTSEWPSRTRLWDRRACADHAAGLFGTPLLWARNLPEALEGVFSASAPEDASSTSADNGTSTTSPLLTTPDQPPRV